MDTTFQSRDFITCLPFYMEDTVGGIVSGITSIPQLIILASKHVDKLFSVNVLIDFEVLDLVFEFLQPVGLRHLVLGQPLPITFDLFDLFMQFFNHFFSC